MLRHFRVPTFVPVLAIASCLVLLGQQNWETWMRAGVLIIVGMLLHGWSRLNLSPMSKPG
ncbi:hypothetical protein LIS66_09930 [Pseudomonas sp. HN2]|uniref:amino acid permease C-terminal domain-containing protein n=1 Tax=Pseudomonas sp. HN2 TaxID=2884805 RepID=UPI001D15388C|nr:amino acid permease C-terminal domain-containing protein [Pseudomonas sp. HN2]UEB97860.1 hypothetical protein LIS66_09930 [Pseudomonas sp. HN2]